MVDVAKLAIEVRTDQVKKAQRDLQGLERTGTSLQRSMGNIPALFTAIATSMAVGKVVEYADAMKLVEGRLKLVTNSTEELVTVQNELFDISQRSRVSFTDTADLYSRIARSTKDLSISSSELLGITETISQTLIISGGSAESMNAALIQLGQGFASGTLRGEELNSVMEQTPRLAQAISEGMGVTIGELRSLAQEGRITAEAIVEALKSQGIAVQREFTQMPKTIEQGINNATNSIQVLIGEFDRATNASTKVSNGFLAISSAIDNNRREIVAYSRYALNQVNLVIESLMATGKLFVTGLTSIYYGTLNSVIQISLMATESLNSIGLASDETLEKTKRFADYVNGRYKASINLGADTIQGLVDAYNEASKSPDTLAQAIIKAEKKVEQNRKGKTTTFSSGDIDDFEVEFQKLKIKQIEDEIALRKELINLGKTASQIEKDELQDKFDRNREFIESNIEAYEAYSNRMIELDNKIAEEFKQRRIEMLESSGGFFDGIEARGLQYQDNSTMLYKAGQEAFESFTNNASNSLYELFTTGQTDSKKFTAALIRDIGMIVIKEQVAALTIKGIEASKLAFKSMAENVKQGMIATTAATEMSKNAATTSTVIASEGAKTSAAATTSAVSSMQGIPFPLNIVALGATVAAITSVISKGFADGGFTGVGGKHEAAGIVHKGEVVFSQEDVARHGGVGAVENMRLGNGFSDGGIVGAVPIGVPTMQTRSTPNVSVVIENNTGFPISDTFINESFGIDDFGQEEKILTIVMNGFENNTLGFRDTIGAS